VTKEEMKIKIMNYLLSTPYANKVNDTQIRCRCIFCGDSISDERATHLYIKIDPYNNEPILYNCFRGSCGMSGVLTPQVLREFEIRDLDLSSSLTSYNNQSMKNLNTQINRNDRDLDLKIPAYKTVNKRLVDKKDYLCNRLGVDLSFKELYDLRTVFSLYDFLNLNKIDTLTMKKNITDIIDKDYIGFLTVRNEFIIFRNIYNNKNMRYIKYPIFKTLENTKKFYTIPNQIDLLTNDKIIINIAEGVFDILGVYFNVYDKKINNTIYIAVTGTGYYTPLKYFLDKGVFGNVELNIFSDRGIHENFYVKKLKNIMPWLNDIDVFYNKLSKDFGVSKREIKIIKKALLTTYI
jgi:hypothetical protein